MRLISGVLVSAAVMLSACGASDNASADKLDVIVGVYPVEEIVKVVGGDHVEVRNVVPPGAEPHDVELAPDDVSDVIAADLVLYIGGGFQTALEDAGRDSDGTAVDVLDSLGKHESDPHVWLDPRLQAELVDVVVRLLSQQDSAHADEFAKNADAYKATLTHLDEEISEDLRNCARRDIVVPHEAFGYLAHRYDLDQIGITGVSPEAEPDARQMSRLTTMIREKGITTIFSERQGSPEVVEALADETGARVEKLDALETLSQEQLDEGVTYVDVMRANASALKSGLDCG